MARKSRQTDKDCKCKIGPCGQGGLNFEYVNESRHSQNTQRQPNGPANYSDSQPENAFPSYRFWIQIATPRHRIVYARFSSVPELGESSDNHCGRRPEQQKCNDGQ